jgi:hypothetical protein
MASFTRPTRCGVTALHDPQGRHGLAIEGGQGTTLRDAAAALSAAAWARGRGHTHMVTAEGVPPHESLQACVGAVPAAIRIPPCRREPHGVPRYSFAGVRSRCRADPGLDDQGQTGNPHWFGLAGGEGVLRSLAGIPSYWVLIGT